MARRIGSESTTIHAQYILYVGCSLPAVVAEIVWLVEVVQKAILYRLKKYFLSGLTCLFHEWNYI